MKSEQDVKLDAIDEYFRGTTLLNDAQRKELESIFSFIHANTLQDDRETKKTTKKVAPEIKKEMAEDEIIALQRIWRTRLLANEFYSKQGREIYWEMLDRQDPYLTNSETNLLAKLMYGKTIAGVKTNVIKASSDDFPVYQHPDWPSQSYYHRDDPLEGTLIDDVVKHFKVRAKWANHLFVPITIVNNASIEDFVKNNLSKEQQQFVHIHKKDGETLGIVELLYESGARKNESADNILKKLRSAGLVASPWEIAKFNAQNRKDSQGSQYSQDETTMSRLLAKLPSTPAELKMNDIMVELSRIAVKKDNPNRLLAACLHRMISALPEENVKPEIVQRISLFLNFGVKFYNNNYERFSFSVYAITHEISLLINDAMKNGVKITDYNKFKQTTERDAISSFGLTGGDNNNYKTIAAPAMAGTHAFMIALNLAKNMALSSGGIPTIQEIGSTFFEFDEFFPAKKHTDADGIADIYHMSSGPIVTPDGIIPGTDINKLIKNKILKSGVRPTKPVTIIVDVTTGLHKNLKLDDDVKKYIESGDISIICHESYQKFGLAHTDQVQGGVVYGVCSATSFSSDVINSFEEKAAKDLENHLDMVVASFMHEHSGYYIELIKEQHFKSGALFNEYFNTTHNSVQSYDEMLENLNELYFLININNPEFLEASYLNLTSRDSFGHFSSSLAEIGSAVRISPNASDKIDILIQITQLSLSSKFTRDELFGLLVSFLESRVDNDKPFSKAQEIIFTGLLMTLKNQIKSEPKLTIEEQSLLVDGINHLVNLASDSLSGRNAYQILRNVSKTLETEMSCEALLDALSNNDRVSVEDLLQNMKVNILNIKDENGSTFLHLAAKNNQPEIVKMLLKYGADPNIIDAVGCTPLHIAVASRKINVIKELLNNEKVDRSAKDINDFTPLMIAANFEKISGTSSKLTEKNNLKINLTIIEMLLTDKMVNKDTQDYDVSVALQIAKQNTNQAIFEFLEKVGSTLIKVEKKVVNELGASHHQTTTQIELSLSHGDRSLAIDHSHMAAAAKTSSDNIHTTSVTIQTDSPKKTVTSSEQKMSEKGTANNNEGDMKKGRHM